MEGKLIKQEDKYYALYNTEGTFISDVNGGSIANKLSLKNCEAIENGYDLDELLDGLLINRGEHPSRVRNPLYGEERQLAKDLVQKALEILGDKKFSEEDMMQAIITTQVSDSIKNNDDRLELIQSLQQTEWDVEIVMDAYYYEDFLNDGETHILEEKFRPLLDADGCLILKRIQ